MITSAALIEPLRDLVQHRYGRGQSEYLDIS